MTALSLIATAGYLPETVIDNQFFGGRDDDQLGSMFKGARLRHHLAPGQTAAEMIARATETLAARCGIDPRRDVDLILTNVSLPDQAFTGCGAMVAHRLGCAPRLVIDLHNGGCVSFIYMMQVARAVIAAGDARTALICNAQTAAGRLFADPGNRHRPQSAVPGDGAGVGFVVGNDESPVLAIASRCYPDFADDMQLRSDDDGAYWQPRSAPLYVDFTEARIASIAGRGNRMVPELVRDACAQAGLTTGDLDVLVTNQPSPIFLRNWRESLGVAPEAHVHTFAEHGNLFGAALPICLERAVADGTLTPGHHVALGGFAHAGDYAAAAVVRWRARA